MRKHHEYNWIAFFRIGLKILSWVTLACRFKSGPGHHSKAKPNTYLTSQLPGDLDNKRQVSTPLDAFMMWVSRG
jgi:hypothetical protein